MKLKGIFLLLSILPLLAPAQISPEDAASIDSIKIVIAQSPPDTTLASALEEWGYLTWDSDPKLSLELYQKVDSICSVNLQKDLSKAERDRFLDIRATSLNELGMTYDDRGNLTKAMDYYMTGLKITEESNHTVGMASFLNNMGIIYKNQEDFELAKEKFVQSLELEKSIDRKSGIANALHNLGTIHQDQYQYDSAIVYYRQSLAVEEELGDPVGIAVTLNVIGESYENLDQPDTAMKYFTRALEVAESIGYEMAVAEAYNGIGDVYASKGNYRKAIQYCHRALDLGEEIERLISIRRAHRSLAMYYEKTGRYKDALENYKRFITAQDSIRSETNQKAIIQQQYKYEYEKQAAADSIKNAEEVKVKDALLSAEQAENKQRTQQIYFLFIGLVLTGLFLIFFINRVLVIRKQKGIIQAEKNRSDELLLNILPAEVAEELKAKGKAEAQLIDLVTVIFTDFKGFTALSEVMTPQVLLEEINLCYSAFDRIMEKYNIEKIKTIGDAYMAAGGLPVPNTTHPIDVVNAAIEIQEFISQRGAQKTANGEPFFEIRIGVHTGSVIAGIVGLKKFQYDIWGDTVNIASRMESSGQVGRVNLSETTYELVKDQPAFSFESRGKIMAKGKGELQMYFVSKQAQIAE